MSPSNTTASNPNNTVTIDLDCAREQLAGKNHDDFLQFIPSVLCLLRGRVCMDDVLGGSDADKNLHCTLAIILDIFDVNFPNETIPAQLDLIKKISNKQFDDILRPHIHNHLMAAKPNDIFPLAMKYEYTKGALLFVLERDDYNQFKTIMHGFVADENGMITHDDISWAVSICMKQKMHRFAERFLNEDIDEDVHVLVLGMSCKTVYECETDADLYNFLSPRQYGKHSIEDRVYQNLRNANKTNSMKEKLHAAVAREEAEMREMSDTKQRRAIAIDEERIRRHAQVYASSKATAKAITSSKKKKKAPSNSTYHETKSMRQQAFEVKQQREHQEKIERQVRDRNARAKRREIRNALPGLECEYAPPVRDGIGTWTGTQKTLAEVGNLAPASLGDHDRDDSTVAHTAVFTSYDTSKHVVKRAAERRTDPIKILDTPGDIVRQTDGSVVVSNDLGTVVRNGAVLVTTY